MIGAAKKATGKVCHSHRDRPPLQVDWGLSHSLCFFVPSFLSLLIRRFIFPPLHLLFNQQPKRSQKTMWLENDISVVSEGTSLHWPDIFSVWPARTGKNRINLMVLRLQRRKEMWLKSWKIESPSAPSVGCSLMLHHAQLFSLNPPVSQLLASRVPLCVHPPIGWRLGGWAFAFTSVIRLVFIFIMIYTHTLKPTQGRKRAK